MNTIIRFSAKKDVVIQLIIFLILVVLNLNCWLIYIYLIEGKPI